MWCPNAHTTKPGPRGLSSCMAGHHTLFAWVSCAYINCAVAFYFAAIAIVYTGLWCLYCDSLNYHYCDWLCFLYIHIMLYMRFLWTATHHGSWTPDSVLLWLSIFSLGCHTPSITSRLSWWLLPSLRPFDQHSTDRYFLPRHMILTNFGTWWYWLTLAPECL